MKKNNIILIGMMGAGKSTVAKELHKKLKNFTLIDTDNEIEKFENCTISEIFENKGEKYFRNIETQIIKKLCDKNYQIIATGGGIFEKEENRNILKQNGTTIYLRATAKNLYDRIKNETHRPLLKNGFGINNIEEILNKRDPNYAQADLTIDTNDKIFYNIVNEIIEKGKFNE